MKITGKQLAQILGISPRTVEQWRCAGKGPAFVLVDGVAMYPADSLVEWMVEPGNAKVERRIDALLGATSTVPIPEPIITNPNPNP